MKNANATLSTGQIEVREVRRVSRKLVQHRLALSITQQLTACAEARWRMLRLGRWKIGEVATY
jgi:hypothetical protein